MGRISVALSDELEKKLRFKTMKPSVGKVHACMTPDAWNAGSQSHPSNNPIESIEIDEKFLLQSED